MKNEASDQSVEMSKNAAEPPVRLSPITAQAVEQVVQQQRDLARDCGEMGTREDFPPNIFMADTSLVVVKGRLEQSGRATLHAVGS